MGVYLSAGNNTLTVNYIETNAAGTGAIANNNGIYLQSSSNTIGGTTVAARNVIAGNTSSGIYGVSGTNNVIQGNTSERMLRERLV